VTLTVGYLENDQHGIRTKKEEPKLTIGFIPCVDLEKVT
jgi:hypothetical protein